MNFLYRLIDTTLSFEFFECLLGTAVCTRAPHVRDKGGGKVRVSCRNEMGR